MYKHKIQIILVLSVFLCISCASRGATDNEMTASKPEIDPAKAIPQAEELYKKRSELVNVREALKILDKARDMNNRNYEVEWKFAQYSYYLGNAYGVSDEEAEKVLKKGLTAARIAKRMEPNKPEGFFWYGAILGEQSKRNPVTVGIVSFDNIKEAMRKVIEIDPTYQGASAYDALGLVELKTVGLAGGDAKKAVEILEKGVEIEKNNSFLRLHLAEAYLAVDKKAEAKKQLDYLLNMKPDPEFLPEYERSVMEAKKLLDQKF